MFAEILHRNADRTLFACDDGASFAYAAALDLSQHPAIQGTRRRVVFCLCANVPGALLGYLGLIAAGAVPVMLNAMITTSQLVNLWERYRPDYAWLPQARMNEFPDARPVLVDWGHTLVAFDKLASAPINDDLAMLLSTSGSTGSPKMVRISHKNIASNAKAISNYLALTSDERPISTLPPSYTYGLSILHSHLLHGCTIALTNRTLFDRGFWEFLKSSKASSMSGVPYHYEMLRKLRFSDMDLPELRTITQAGGHLSHSLASEYAAHCASRGMRFFIMYGQVEATARMGYLAPEKTLYKPDSIGQPIPGGRFWLEDESGQPFSAVETTGQLVYQGSNVCMGYAESAQDLAKGDEFGGILRTGDLARRDSDGDYYIVGRIKRFLKLFGHRVNLQEIEDALQAAGQRVACSGCDDQLDVYLCKGTSEAAKSIKSQLVNQLRLTPASVRVLNVADLPRNEAGKIQYADLTKLTAEILA